MYGSANPILRHFGADELATQATLQSIEARRAAGEYVPPSEDVIPRPTPGYDEYFEFSQPVASGVAPGARDELLEEAMGAYRGPQSYTSYSPPSSPPPASYDSPREGSYHGQGVSDGSASPPDSGGRSPPSYYDPRPRAERRTYGAYGSQPHTSRSVSPGSASSPERSSGSPGPTPRRSYADSSVLAHPPFRAGMPANERPRRPGTGAAGGGGAGGRRGRTGASSASPERSSSPQPQSSDPAGSDAQPQPQAQPSSSDPRSSEAGGAMRVRGIGTKISGRPASAVSPGASPGPGARRRPASAVASPAGAAGSRQAGAAARAGGVGAGPRRPPAWSPAAGIANVRLEDMDEATRVAAMLNDPSARAELRARQPGNQAGGAGAEGGEGPSVAPSPGMEATVSPRDLGQSPGPSTGGGAGSPGAPGEGVSPRWDRNRAHALAEEYFQQYRLRTHRESQGVPSYRFAQPRSHGPMEAVSQKYFSFDEAHPAIADQHYHRSNKQDGVLAAERRKMQQEKMRSARAAARKGLSSPAPSAPQLAAEVDRLVRVREAGRARLRQLEEEGEVLRDQTRQVQQRALEAIARSNQITSAGGYSRSPSPGPRTRSRSPSPSPAAFYSGRGGGGGGYGRGPGFFGPPGGPYSPGRSPSGGRGLYRPASALPAYGADGQDGGYYGGYSQFQREQYDRQQYDAHQEAYRQYSEGEGEGGGGRGQRPLSAPPGASPQGAAAVSPGLSPTPHSPPEAQQILDMIDAADRLPQHEQRPVDPSHPHPPPPPGHPPASPGAAGGRPPSRGGAPGRGAAEAAAGEGGGLADHLARASAVFHSRDARGLLDQTESAIAIGAYDPARYDEYQRQVDLEMQRRAVEGDYESDIDRDEAAQLLVEGKDQADEDEEEARQRAIEASWHVQDQWMDDYRQRLGPEDGYVQRSARSEGEGEEGEHDPTAGSPLRSQRSVLSDAEEAVVAGPYVPIVSAGLPRLPDGYSSEGPRGGSGSTHFFKSTVPQPFSFVERERNRPKPIATVKLEQDLALRAQEEVAGRQPFRARPLPPAVVEPRYEQMLLEAEVKRQLTHQQRLEELASIMEKPFSFYYRDQEREEAREALARAAKDPRRFQVPYRAREPPPSTKEERFRRMMLELEAKRGSTRRRVEEARRHARERVEAETARRQEAASRAYQERLRSVDPGVHYPGPHAPKPMGAVPDFNALHRQFEVAMARERANIRKRITVPQEFRLNGTTPDQQADRGRKIQERRNRIILDMQVDSELLPEMRWPYKSPRGKVRPTPIPAYLVERMGRDPGSKAADLRKSSNRMAAGEGAFGTRAEKDAAAKKASEKLRAEALKRADKLLKASVSRQQAEAAAAGGGADFGLMSDVGATAAAGADQSSTSRGASLRRRAAVMGREDNPEVYVEARHQQIERRVREVVEDTLLDQGIAAYRYVESVEGAGGGSTVGGGGGSED
ncbi:hypothetical protein HYH03_009552 [Edaphochlamys debaryana]|uniref:Uncharacterized protein n=1 Tax=Edaphochlamys debaryana TaxID=47281 RepID=A0A836BYA9_9CHLO|nr:hypothetical protein HYH03_009552 [Edaphochlamys debaryana]|eukprot:KAG2492054.1 hypothetical protein HYH03_009552 [Edaphochlamys debaryana]